MDTPETVGQDAVPAPRTPSEQAPPADPPVGPPGQLPGAPAWPPPPVWPRPAAPAAPPAPAGRTPYVPLPTSPATPSTVPFPPADPTLGGAPSPGPTPGSAPSAASGYGPPPSPGSSYGSSPGPTYGGPPSPVPGYGSSSSAGSTYGSSSPAGPAYGSFSPAGPAYGSSSPAGPAYGSSSPAGPTYGGTSPAGPSPGSPYGPPPAAGPAPASASPAGQVYGSAAPPGTPYGGTAPGGAGPAYGTRAPATPSYGATPGSTYGTPAPPGAASGSAASGSAASGRGSSGIGSSGSSLSAAPGAAAAFEPGAAPGRPAGMPSTLPFPPAEVPGGIPAGPYPPATRPTAALPPYPRSGPPYPPLYPQPGQSTYPPAGGTSYPSYLPGHAQATGYPGYGQPVSAVPQSPYAYGQPTTYPPTYGQPPAYPGYDPYGGYRYPTPPRRKRRGPVIAAILAILLLGGIGALAAKSLTSVVGRKTPTGPQAGPVASGSTTHAGSQTIEDVLAGQDKAIVAGDQKGFLAGVDPKATSALNTYKMIYGNLRAMRVTRWAQRIEVGGGAITSRKSFDVDISYCLLVSPCDGDQAKLHITAEGHAGRIMIESATLPRPNASNKRPYPWEATRLVAVAGDRVVVAASDAYAYKLKTVLPIAENAAKVADTYAHWGKPPVYVVYLAGPTDKTKWFGGELKNTLGEALPLTSKDIEVMLVMPLAGEVRYAGPGTLNAVLQHEMTHVATLYGDDSDYGHDTLIEGIAEYGAYNGHSSWAQYRLEDTRAFLRSGKWSGKCYLTSEITSKSVITASGSYGVGYLTIKRLVSRFGMNKMLDFWGEVERDGHSVETASNDVLGQPWSSVNADCASYIHNFVGA